MSYLQHGHIEESFYKRSSKSYLKKDNASHLDTDNNDSFLTRSNDTFLSPSSDSYLAGNLTVNSYLTKSDSSFLTVDRSSTSHVIPTNKSFIENTSTSYLSLVGPASNNNRYLKIDKEHHVTEDHALHLDEDEINHLEESGGETSDEENEDFSHVIDWSLVVPPFIKPIFDNGSTKYQCSLSKKVYNSMPIIPERFDLFDFDKITLIETIARYHTEKNGNIDGIKKYKELMNKRQNLHNTELQSVALENLRVWKHKKEQELLGQVNIVNADYSDRTERMGVGDHSKEGAAERKRRRDLLKKRQEKDRKKQQSLKERLKQEQYIKSQEELVKQRKMAQQRKIEQQRIMQENVNKSQEENIWRKQQRSEEQQKKQDFMKFEQKNISKQRQQELLNMMQSGLEEKYSEQSSNRLVKRNEFDSFLSNINKSQEDARYNIKSQRSDRFKQQDQDRIDKTYTINQQRANIDYQQKQKEAERLKKMEIKNFVTKIYNLLDIKTCGIDYDEFPNEYYFRYNEDWNPRRILGLIDLDDIFRSNGLQSTVDIIRGGMTRRVIARKHYQKIKIVSNNTNDILTVLAISDTIDSAIGQLRAMINQRESAKKQQESTRGGGGGYGGGGYGGYGGGRIDYSQSNNWGLPRGYRVKKTAKGRLFFVNDATKSTTWDDPRPLPFGWRQRKTEKGKAFYINDNTKDTTWNDPRPKIWI